MITNRQIVNQNQYISVDGTLIGYSKQGFRNYGEIKYFVEISRRSISYLYLGEQIAVAETVEIVVALGEQIAVAETAEIVVALGEQIAVGGTAEIAVVL